MIHWKPIGEYVEPNWIQQGTALPPMLFWRTSKGATLGYIRDGELFDAKWVYVCDSNKVTRRVLSPSSSMHIPWSTMRI